VDLQTLSLDRLLVARTDVSDDVVQAITDVLMVHRQEMAAEITEAPVRALLSNIRKPEGAMGLAVAVHPGALAYYNPNPTSFVTSHPDLIGFLVLAAAVAWLWMGSLRRVREAMQKARARDYQTTIQQLVTEIRSSATEEQLAPVRAELVLILNSAIRDLGNNRITEDSFQAIQVIWQVAIDLSRNLKSAQTLLGPGPTVEQSDDEPIESERRWWKFGRLSSARASGA
jgi:type II secretory pathway pseudopilin PulG